MILLGKDEGILEEKEKDYILNVIISGHEDHIANFGAFLVAWTK